MFQSVDHTVMSRNFLWNWRELLFPYDFYGTGVNYYNTMKTIVNNGEFISIIQSGNFDVQTLEIF